PGGVVLDQFAALAVQREGGVLTGPAQVAARRRPRVVARVLRLRPARGVPLLDRTAGLEVEALADPGRLVVGGRRPPVDAARGVAEGELRCRSADARRHTHRVVPGEVARGAADLPGRGGGQLRGAEVAGASGRGGLDGVQVRIRADRDVTGESAGAVVLD